MKQKEKIANAFMNLIVWAMFIAILAGIIYGASAVVFMLLKAIGA